LVTKIGRIRGLGRGESLKRYPMNIPPIKGISPILEAYQGRKVWGIKPPRGIGIKLGGSP